MSKQNKVNPGQYHQGGRLTPDDLARERMKQQETVPRDTGKTSGEPPDHPQVQQSDAAAGEADEK
jgi:hypothetical protein